MFTKPTLRLHHSILNLTSPPQCLRLLTTTTPPISSIPTPHPTTTSPPTTSPPPSSTTKPLTWNTYLHLRRKRRHYNLAASILTSINTTAAGITFLSSQNFDAMNVFGLDPFLVLGAATAISGASGWLLGPFVGNAVFGIVYRRIRAAIAAKDTDFYTRIKRYRVDPSGQSVSNPVPDYYGEKIGSVAEFRAWLKDQRAYNKKRGSFL